jgi:hypothetical protein
MSVRVPVHVGECPADGDFRTNLVEACRSESDDVGVGWGKVWGKRSKSNWRLPVQGDVAGDHNSSQNVGNQRVVVFVIIVLSRGRDGGNSATEVQDTIG